MNGKNGVKSRSLLVKLTFLLGKESSMNRILSLRQQPLLAYILFGLAFLALSCTLWFSTPLMSYLLEHNRYCNSIGIFVILAIAVLFSHDRSKINLKLVAISLMMHFTLAFVMLKTIWGQQVINSIAGLITNLYQAADGGINFMFGSLAQPQGPWGFIFAFKVLPIIVFFGAFMSLLFHLGIIQRIVFGIGKVLQPLLGTSGPETLCSIANSFLGQTEAPLLIRHYLKSMTKSEFLVVMISGMGTISGAILAVFVAMGVPGKHLLTSSIMSIPAAILISKIIYPEIEQSERVEPVIATEHTTKNMLDAISQGTSDGLQLALNVGAMLITFIAFIGLINTLLSFSCVQLNSAFSFLKLGIELPIITLEMLFSWLCIPFAWLMGFSGTQAMKIGELIGTKIAINELVAYSKMVTMGLSDRAITLVTYALCGFSNFSCIGIQIGGIGVLAPEKRAWLSQLGLRALLGGVLVNLLSAMIVGLLL